MYILKNSIEAFVVPFRVLASDRSIVRTRAVDYVPGIYLVFFGMMEGASPQQEM
jgi:hypothetical protein